MDRFYSLSVDKLQEYLKERGVTYSKLKKNELVELCQLAYNNKLDTDPNCFLDDITETIQEKLLISGKKIPNPKNLHGTSRGTSDITSLTCIYTFDTLLDKISADKIFGGQNFSADKMFGTMLKFRQFYLLASSTTMKFN